MTQNNLTGRVVQFRSSFYEVETVDGIVTCQMRGKLKQTTRDGDQVALGDLVEISVQSGGKGSVEKVLPRSGVLGRLVPTARGAYQQVLVANLDQVVLVFACANPEPSLRMLDRFLVIAEKNDIPALIVANKVDLVGLQAAEAMFSIYPELGYQVIYASTVEQLGIDALHQRLTGKISAFAGPSGVGKTSLLNCIQPHLGLDVKEISTATNKGRHTTVVRRLFPLRDGGYVADLPGLRQLALWDIEPEELDGYFPELRQLVPYCQFSDCTHVNEPGCAVLQAIDEGLVSPERYESYLRIRFGDE